MPRTWVWNPPKVRAPVATGHQRPTFWCPLTSELILKVEIGLFLLSWFFFYLHKYSILVGIFSASLPVRSHHFFLNEFLSPAGDIWAAGTVVAELVCGMSTGHFFSSVEDLPALAELALIFGCDALQEAAQTLQPKGVQVLRVN